MPETILKLIPKDPDWIPGWLQTPSNGQQLASYLKSSLPRAKALEFIARQNVEFIDPGGNFKRILCPNCKAKIPLKGWKRAVKLAEKNRFQTLGMTPACCKKPTSLNDLDYDCPAGFARFSIDVHDPGIERPLSPDVQRFLEAMAGTPLRQVWTR